MTERERMDEDRRLKALAYERQRVEAASLLESSRIQWNRDWDALLIGFVLGVLAVIVIGLSWRVLLDEGYRPVRVEQR